MELLEGSDRLRNWQPHTHRNTNHVSQFPRAPPHGEPGGTIYPLLQTPPSNAPASCNQHGNTAQAAPTWNILNYFFRTIFGLLPLKSGVEIRGRGTKTSAKCDVTVRKLVT